MCDVCGQDIALDQIQHLLVLRVGKALKYVGALRVEDADCLCKVMALGNRRVCEYNIPRQQVLHTSITEPSELYKDAKVECCMRS